MKRLLFLSFALFLSMNLMAQITFGPRVGLNMSKYAYNYSNNSEAPDVKFKFGFGIAGVMNWQINDFLALQPAIGITKKGSSYDVKEEYSGQATVEGYSRDRVTYIDVPVNIAAGIRLGPGQIQLFAGPYIAYAIAGKNRYDIQSTGESDPVNLKDTKKIKFTNKIEEGDHDDDDIASFQRPFDYGVNIGLGYSYNQLLFNIGFAMGLANLQPDVAMQGFDPNDFKFSNRSIFFTVAWLFGAE